MKSSLRGSRQQVAAELARRYYSAVSEPFASAAGALTWWADRYRRGVFRVPLPSGSWQAADDLVRVAKHADLAAGGTLAEFLEVSNRTLDPLADPLAVDFGTHRWLSAEREEAYSDWLKWILEQIGDARRLMEIFGVPAPQLLRRCASEEPVINRERGTRDDRPDLVIEFGQALLVVVEIKTKPFDRKEVRDQLKRYSQLAPDPPRGKAYFVAVDPGDFDCPEPFQSLPWRELALRLREQAWDWIRRSKNQRRDRSDLVRGAITLAFCGAVEQNLLGLSGKAVPFRTRLSAEYLEEWSKRT